MAISPYIKRLRHLIGHELLLLPSVAVLPRRPDGAVLLVRLIDTGQWATIGGAVEPDESPHQAARREAKEEAGIEVALGPILGVVGGPEYRVTYPNGDLASYVATVFEATVTGGLLQADGDETSSVKWWDSDALPYDEMGTLTRALLRDVGLGVAPA